MSNDNLVPSVQAFIEVLADAIASRLRTDIDLQPQPTTAPTELDVYGVAELLNCSVATIERRTKSKEIPSYKVGNLRRYNRAAVLAALQERTEADE
jgi:excisionase family DNA binding protein